MPKFFISRENFSDGNIKVEGDNFRHLKKVLRAKTGDIITVCDMKGTDYEATIAGIANDYITLRILSSEKNANEPDIKVSLFQGIPKGDKFSLITEKCVEAGVYDITPVLMTNCVVKTNKKDYEQKISRLQKVSEAAAKQCGRGIIPAINPLMTVNDVIASAGNYDICLFPYENEKETTLKKPLKNFSGKSAAIIIGPEGGFTAEEAAALCSGGFIPVSLGKRILRTETAGMAALFNITYELEL